MCGCFWFDFVSCSSSSSSSVYLHLAKSTHNDWFAHVPHFAFVAMMHLPWGANNISKMYYRLTFMNVFCLQWAINDVQWTEQSFFIEDILSYQSRKINKNENQICFGKMAPGNRLIIHESLTNPAASQLCIIIASIYTPFKPSLFFPPQPWLLVIPLPTSRGQNKLTRAMKSTAAPLFSRSVATLMLP